MAYDIPYHTNTIRPVMDFVPDNQASEDPVEFDICPAWGPDWARIKSIVYASIGLAQDGIWSPEVQAAVIAAFDTGASAFINTVERIRGLTIPAIMAVRAGILVEIPKGGKPTDKVPIINGLQFSRICGAVPVMALQVASEIAKLSQKAEMDPRFFAQPSGSGGAATSTQTASTAKPARPTPRRRGTAGAKTTTATPPATT